jgi:AraC-like DNA-binding protein
MQPIKVSMNNIHALLACAEKAGHDVPALLRPLGLELATLDGELEIAERWRVYDDLIRSLQVTYTGIEPGRLFGERDRDIFFYYIVGADTFLEVLERVVIFFDAYHERMGSRCQLEHHCPNTLLLRGDFGLPAALNQPLLISSLRHVQQLLYMLSWLMNKNIAVMKLGIPAAYSAELEQQLTVFGCPIQYETAEFELWFPAALAAKPVVRDLADVKVFLSCFQGVLMVVNEELPLADVVATLMERHCQQAGSMLTLPQLALVLNMSEATLRRRLSAHSTHGGFSAIRQHCQLELAKRLLADFGYAVDTVAQRVGFLDANAFRRSFKRWTGLTPSQYRQQVEVAA